VQHLVPVAFPLLPIANAGGLAPDQRLVIRNWCGSAPQLSELRGQGLWTNLHDRIAEYAPFLRAQEHSAQIERPVLEIYEQGFREGRINILNCTTTMEMGVDIPHVSLVVNANVPPSVSNYRQRVGRAGRIFTMLKFRTLTPDAEARLGPYLGHDLTQRTEAEVTRLGRVLRRMHFDELPQLWNVLRGDMSLVGPRPIRPAFFEELCEQIPQYWQRLVVEPGMTGFAQLRMTRETSWSEKLAHDLEYIADRSVALYFRVVAATAWRVLKSPFRAPGSSAS